MHHGSSETCAASKITGKIKIICKSVFTSLVLLNVHISVFAAVSTSALVAIAMRLLAFDRSVGKAANIVARFHYSFHLTRPSTSCLLKLNKFDIAPFHNCAVYFYYPTGQLLLTSTGKGNNCGVATFYTSLRELQKLSMSDVVSSYCPHLIFEITGLTTMHVCM